MCVCVHQRWAVLLGVSIGSVSAVKGVRSAVLRSAVTRAVTQRAVRRAATVHPTPSSTTDPAFM